MGFIYKITNLVSRKCYIGETTRSNPETRWKQQWQFYINKEDETFLPYTFASPQHSSRSGFDDVLVVTCDILPIQEEEPTQKDFEVDMDDGDEQECEI